MTEPYGPLLKARPVDLVDPTYLALRKFLHTNGIGCRRWDNEVRCAGAMSVLHNSAARQLLEGWRMEQR